MTNEACKCGCGYRQVTCKFCGEIFITKSYNAQICKKETCVIAQRRENYAKHRHKHVVGKQFDYSAQKPPTASELKKEYELQRMQELIKSVYAKSDEFTRTLLRARNTDITNWPA